MITLREISENSPLLLRKGYLCVTVKEGETKKINHCGKKKYPASRGGRTDDGTLLKDPKNEANT